ncbi:MAG TPA: hypothetical protein VN666_06235 [Nitrospira sp.]|nr:hypothetical protein [Nitrospira sp.]
MLHRGVKQHDGMSGPIRRFQALLFRLFQPRHHLALQQNRRVMLRCKWDGVHLFQYVGGDDAIEAPELSDLRWAILGFLAILAMALRRPSGVVLGPILTLSHRQPASNDRKADEQHHPPQSSLPPL